MQVHDELLIEGQYYLFIMSKRTETSTEKRIGENDYILGRNDQKALLDGYDETKAFNEQNENIMYKVNRISNILLSSDIVGQFIDDTTTSNPLLDENGQFNDAPTAFNNIVEYFDNLQLFEKFMEKLPTIIIAIVFILLGVLLSKLAKKLVVKSLQARNLHKHFQQLYL